MRFTSLILLTFLSMPALAGQPANPNPPPATPVATVQQPAVAPPMVTTTLAPDGTVTVTEPVPPNAAPNRPFGRTNYTLATPNGCQGLQISGFQQVRARTALSLQAGASDHLDACGRFVVSQAEATQRMLLAQAAAERAQAAADYTRIDAENGTLVQANGTSAVWAASSNGGQMYPMGLMPGGMYNPAAGSSYQLLSTGLGQQTPGAGIVVLPTTPTTTTQARPTATRSTSATTAVTKPTTQTTTTTSATPNLSDEAAAALIRGIPAK